MNTGVLRLHSGGLVTMEKNQVQNISVIIAH